MKLLGRKNEDPDPTSQTGSEPDADPAATRPAPAGTTAPKGRPTPKRDAKKRGPVAPAPMTAAEARKRRKEMRSKLTKEERKEQRLKERAVLSQRRERMMAGEEAYLLPRDQGPVRRYARDLVDSRRNFLGLFMPSAIFMIFVMMMLPQLQYYVSPMMLLWMVVMTADALLISRRVNKAVEAKFPDNTESRFKLGLYAAGRASQLRRMRIPRPQVKPGTTID
ncbi:MAG TPA: DUF3043 domain-containing protein [Mycobacterium sp.]|nr:DUF3043 domain-containing protein [Mycobacterium sp.]HQE14297.1 DUF3043 domain-containing protein [Mycobacterium sp.]